MADDIVLEYLRAIRATLGDMQETLAEHGRRLTNIERALANHALGASDQSERIDRLVARVARIERRLDLETPET